MSKSENIFAFIFFFFLAVAVSGVFYCLNSLHNEPAKEIVLGQGILKNVIPTGNYAERIIEFDDGNSFQVYSLDGNYFLKRQCKLIQSSKIFVHHHLDCNN